MLQNGNCEATEGKFSRRSVVKGAAWSVPVVAAAIAAPAAAASTTSAIVAWSANSGNLVWAALPGDSGSATVLGDGPSSFAIQNTAGAISGNVTGTITISPNGTVNLGGRPKGIGVQSITGAQVNTRSASGGSGGILGIVAGRADTTTTTFTYSGGVTSSGLLVLPISFGYTASGSLLAVGVLQSYSASLVLRDSNGVQIGQTVLGALSSLLSANLG